MHAFKFMHLLKRIWMTKRKSRGPETHRYQARGTTPQTMAEYSKWWMRPSKLDEHEHTCTAQTKFETYKYRDVVWAGPSAICRSFFRIAGKGGVGSGALLNILRVNRQLWNRLAAIKWISKEQWLLSIKRWQKIDQTTAKFNRTLRSFRVIECSH